MDYLGISWVSRLQTGPSDSSYSKLVYDVTAEHMHDSEI